MACSEGCSVRTNRSKTKWRAGVQAALMTRSTTAADDEVSRINWDCKPGASEQGPIATAAEKPANAVTQNSAPAAERTSPELQRQLDEVLAALHIAEGQLKESAQQQPTTAAESEDPMISEDCEMTCMKQEIKELRERFQERDDVHERDLEAAAALHEGAQAHASAVVADLEAKLAEIDQSPAAVTEATPGQIALLQDQVSEAEFRVTQLRNEATETAARHASELIAAAAKAEADKAASTAALEYRVRLAIELELQSTQAKNAKLEEALKASEQKVEHQQQRVDQAEEAATWCEAAMCELEAKWAEGEANEQMQANQRREKERKLGEQWNLEEQQGENKENKFASLLVA